MPFREKKAWVTIISLLVVFLPYYMYSISNYHRPDPDIPYLANITLHALLAFVVLQILLIVVARKLSPDDVGIPRDEREQLFAFRAARISYVSLILLVIAATFPMIHWEGGNWGWGMAFLGAIILSEIVRAAVLIVQYRRGY